VVVPVVYFCWMEYGREKADLSAEDRFRVFVAMEASQPVRSLSFHESSKGGTVVICIRHPSSQVCYHMLVPCFRPVTFAQFASYRPQGENER